MKILNELKYVEDIINNKPNFKQKIKYRVVAKYFYHYCGYKDEFLEEKLNEFCEKYVEYFNKVTWFKSVESWCRYAIKNSLFIIKPINITMDEYNKIKQVKNQNQEKVLFILLILSKINQQKYRLYAEDKMKYTETTKDFNFSDYYVIESINEILKLAHVNKKSTADKYKLIRELTELNLIEINKNGKLKINFIDKESDCIYLTIDNFDNYNNWVLEYTSREHGEKVIYCEECGVIEKKRSSTSKYCKECAKEIDKEKARERMKNIRKK